MHSITDVVGIKMVPSIHPSGKLYGAMQTAIQKGMHNPNTLVCTIVVVHILMKQMPITSSLRQAM